MALVTRPSIRLASVVEAANETSLDEWCPVSTTQGGKLAESRWVAVAEQKSQGGQTYSSKPQPWQAYEMYCWT